MIRVLGKEGGVLGLFFFCFYFCSMNVWQWCNFFVLWGKRRVRESFECASKKILWIEGGPCKRTNAMERNLKGRSVHSKSCPLNSANSTIPSYVRLICITSLTTRDCLCSCVTSCVVGAVEPHTQRGEDDTWLLKVIMHALAVTIG